MCCEHSVESPANKHSHLIVSLIKPVRLFVFFFTICRFEFIALEAMCSVVLSARVFC